MGSRFFFSSRRRHTRWPRDWSSDVCSSDLWLQRLVASDGVSEQDWIAEERYQRDGVSADSRTPFTELPPLAQAIGWLVVRSEERRVGKEGRSRSEAMKEAERADRAGRCWRR